MFDFRFMWYADLNELLFFDNGAEIQRTDGRSFLMMAFQLVTFAKFNLDRAGVLLLHNLETIHLTLLEFLKMVQAYLQIQTILCLMGLK